MKNVVDEMKNSQEDLTSRVIAAENRVSELEDDLYNVSIQHKWLRKSLKK